MRSPDGKRGPRVLLVSHVFPRHEDDHVAPFLLRYAQGLRAAGARVVAVAPHEAGLPTRHEVGEVTVERLRYGTDRHERIAYRGEMHRLARTPAGAWQALRLLFATWRRVRRADREGWDVIDVHWLVPSAIAVALALPRTPTRLSVHGTDLALAESMWPVRLVGRWVANRFDQLVAVSEPMADVLPRVLGRPPDHVGPMPMSLPAAAASSAPAGRDHVLAVGRLVPEKGHADLVEAVAMVRRSRPGARLTIVGEGPEHDRLTALADRHDVPLTLPGAVGPGELLGHYLAADVVCLPSHREGFGLVAAEALSQHRPVVACAVGGLTDIVSPETGWLVPPRDVPALADALAAALGDPVEAQRRAAAGAAHVAARWSPEALGQRTVEWLEALGRRDGRAVQA